MLRNREFGMMSIAIASIGLLATIIGFYISNVTGFMVLITSLVVSGCGLTYTIWRYREIEKLANYLREISGGNYSLDVRDNVEGELSILKNEIYKVTNILSEQHASLKREKIHLSDAISDISHQIKTPLTSMIMMADLINEPNLPNNKRDEFTKNIQSQLTRLDWLVSSLLKLSKIDAGTVQFKKEPIFVNKLINSSLDAILLPIDMKQIQVIVDGNDNVSFLGDNYWTEEAFINILKNCVEHSDQGGKLIIKYVHNTLFTEVVISDTGRGITKEDLPYIFTRFYKGKSTNDESVGIGLAMAYKIITSQGGDIEVKSLLGYPLIDEDDWFGCNFTIYHWCVGDDEVK